LKKNKKAEVRYRTVSLPRGLADDVQEPVDEFGYWSGLGAFVREAALEKLRRRQT